MLTDVIIRSVDKAMWWNVTFRTSEAEHSLSQIIDHIVHFMTELIPVSCDLEKAAGAWELPACLSQVRLTWAAEKW